MEFPPIFSRMALPVFAYLLGSISWGVVLTRIFSAIDIRKEGSGNIGATNVTRLLGKKLGVLTLVGDVLKAMVPMLAVHWYYLRLGKAVSPQEVDFAVSLCGGAAFLGHIFPVYLKFKGGKGVAPALGVFLVLQPVAVLISLVIFIGIVYFTGYVALGSLLVSALMTLWIWLLNGTPNHVMLAFLIGVLIWIKHTDNIKRLLAGTEKSMKKDKDSSS